MDAIGVDIGGSGVRVGLVDTTTGTLRSPPQRRPHETGAPAEGIIDGLRRLLTAFPEDAPLGVGFPGVVRGSRVETAPNMRSTWPFTDMSEALGREVHLLNDADAAAAAEHALGASQGCEGTVLMVTIGTGLGTSLHRNGVLVPNLELGLLPHPTRGGVIEAHASGRARREEGLDLPTWAARFQEALDLYEHWMNPDLIVLGGGITESWEAWNGLLTTHAPRRRARFGADAGLIGAAVVASHARGS